MNLIYINHNLNSSGLLYVKPLYLVLARAAPLRGNPPRLSSYCYYLPAFYTALFLIPSLKLFLTDLLQKDVKKNEENVEDSMDSYFTKEFCVTLK